MDTSKKVNDHRLITGESFRQGSNPIKQVFANQSYVMGFVGINKSSVMLRTSGIKKKGRCWRPKLANTKADRSDRLGRPVRPVWAYAVQVELGFVL